MNKLAQMNFFVKWRNNFYRLLLVLFVLFLGFQTWGQNQSDETGIITPFFQALADFSENIPHEKVYLHFDNTSYYQGDNIWFKGYIVTSGMNQLSQLSKTLYVELLNPGGEIIDKRILKVENGQCHGEFTLFHLPFYSGFYEVRAYTKYMLNFGEDIIFSRLLPVFDKPKAEGNFEKKEMLKYGRYGPVGNYPMKRKSPEKGKAVNLRFFPEGGNLIQNIPSRIAFEATDEVGNPIDVRGVVIDDAKQELCQFTSLHEGKGIFTYTPRADKRKDIAEVEYSGKKYRFDLPAGLPQGVVMAVDNLSHLDSIVISLRKNENTPVEMLGLVVLTGGKLQSYAYINFTDPKKEINFRIDKTQFPAGVSQIVLFNGKGEILCDRLIFTGRNDDRLDIRAKTNKPFYVPYEPVDMEISIVDNQTNPIETSFSLAIRDGANEVEYKHNILTDLLLMSEIKGYVSNPSYYFEEGDNAALDLLLMVQGWRRYSWNNLAGIEPFELKYLSEQGIETNGQVVSMVRSKPKPNVDVDLLLKKKSEDEEFSDSFIDTYSTDSEGRFSFVSDLTGRWNMILTVSEKGKKKDHRILLDRLFSPEPKRYRYADMQVNIADNTLTVADEETDDEFEEDFDSFFTAYRDSLSKAGITDKIHNLPEVTIKAKKNTKEQDIRHHRSTSIVYYDVASELDDIYDSGKYIGDDIYQLLKNMDGNFNFELFKGIRSFLYKGKFALFVINYEREPVYISYNLDRMNIRLQSIKSVYINESLSALCEYLPRGGPPCIKMSKYIGSVVFIETYPEGQIPAESAKGVRKTWLEGYSAVKEFYNADYSMLPPESDYRRTLYWNPTVTTDEKGIAKINFYNNSSCRNFSISAETVTSQGTIGVYENK